jgi:hypothetical protein
VSDPARHAAPRGPRPGDRMVRAGAVLFALGVVGVLGVVVPYFLEREEPTGFAVLTALAPLGLAVALLGLLRGARADRQVHD